MLVEGIGRRDDDLECFGAVVHLLLESLVGGLERCEHLRVVADDLGHLAGEVAAGQRAVAGALPGVVQTIECFEGTDDPSLEAEHQWPHQQQQHHRGAGGEPNLGGHLGEHQGSVDEAARSDGGEDGTGAGSEKPPAHGGTRCRHVGFPVRHDVEGPEARTTPVV